MPSLKTFTEPVQLRTQRTVLRAWRDEDLPAWCVMNADPEVRRYFPSQLSTDEALFEATSVREHYAQNGWGLWALEIPGLIPFAGLVGLYSPTYEAHFTPAVEIAWRLAPAAWGQGYATEAARAALTFAFDQLELSEVVALTTVTNEPSRKVMQRLGMQRNADDDFDHPRVPEGHPLRPHVLYRINNDLLNKNTMGRTV